MTEEIENRIREIYNERGVEWLGEIAEIADQRTKLVYRVRAPDIDHVVLVTKPDARLVDSHHSAHQLNLKDLTRARDYHTLVAPHVDNISEFHDLGEDPVLGAYAIQDLVEGSSLSISLGLWLIFGYGEEDKEVMKTFSNLGAYVARLHTPQSMKYGPLQGSDGVHDGDITDLYEEKISDTIDDLFHAGVIDDPQEHVDLMTMYFDFVGTIPYTLLHGDLDPVNILVDNSDYDDSTDEGEIIVGVIDAEHAEFGDHHYEVSRFFHAVRKYSLESGETIDRFDLAFEAFIQAYNREASYPLTKRELAIFETINAYDMVDVLLNLDTVDKQPFSVDACRDYLEHIAAKYESDI